MPVPGATGPGQVVDRRPEIEQLIQRDCGYTVAAGSAIEVELMFRVVDKFVVGAKILGSDSSDAARCALNVALRVVRAIWPVNDGNAPKRYKFAIKGPAAQ